METRLLGKTQIRASRMGLGCATFGREIAEDEAFRIMDHAVENGITLFDTAEAYGGGQARLYRKNSLGVEDEREVSGEMHSSEKIVGRWLRARNARDKITLLTKVTFGFTREHVREALAASLERLQTSRIDLYLYHQFDVNSTYEQAAEAANDCLASGLVGAMGCSNYSGPQLEQALKHGRFEVIESNYNLAAREIEADVLPVAAREQVGVITYSPLGAGFLTGKYTPDRGTVPKGTRFDVIPGHIDVYFHERNFQMVERLRALSERVNLPMAQLATAWAFRNPQVDTVLVGARTTRHLDNALTAMATEFDPSWIRELLPDQP